ncbi:MAG: hypothetical protein F082_224 [bacterium F082]|nr:MAG: hypothetical protein F082_224 [bacterium F082]KWW30918.1 MAG: hypothetical protein AUK64_552 [bacterium P201]
MNKKIKTIVGIATMTAFLTIFAACNLQSCLLSSCALSDAKPSKPFKLVVKMHETDCFSCLQGDAVLKDLIEVADAEIVFNGLNEKSIEKFLETNSLSYIKEVENIKIVSDVNKYEKLNKTPTVSEGFLYDNHDSEFFRFQFRMDGRTMKQLQNIYQEGKTLMETGEAVVLQTEYNNSGIGFLIQENCYVLLNRPLNLCQFFDKKGRLIREISGDSIDCRDIFPEMVSLDSKMVSGLEQIGGLHVSIIDVFVYGREVWVGCQVPFVNNEGNKMIHHSYYEVLSYSLFDQNQKYELVFDGRKDDVSAISFDIREDGCVDALIFRAMEKDTARCYERARCQWDNGKLALIDEWRIDYPSFIHQDFLLYSPSLQDGLLNVSFTDYLMDIDDKTIFTLPFHCNAYVEDNGGFDMRLNMDANLIDWAYDGVMLGVIYRDVKENKYYYLSRTIGEKDFSRVDLPVFEVPIISYSLQTPRLVRCIDQHFCIHSLVMNR